MVSDNFEPSHDQALPTSAYILVAGRLPKVLCEGITMVVMPSSGGAQESTCIKFGYFAGWLFKIDSCRVKDDETRTTLMAYQRECYQVLAEYFYGKRHTKGEIIIDEDASEPESSRLRQVTEARQTFGNQAAAQLWFKLGLPVVPAILHDPRQPSLFDYQAIKTAGPAGGKVIQFVCPYCGHDTG